MMTLLVIWFTGLLLVSAGMVLTWRIAERTANATVVDVVWTFSLGVLAIYYALVIKSSSDLRAWIVAGVVVLWSLRLGWHVFERYRKEQEDARYAEIKKSWGNAASRKLLQFYLVQGIAASLLSIAFLAALNQPASDLRMMDMLAVLVALMSIAGEALADAQLRAFKASSENRGRTCRSGLWAYSRHPNYFFEWTFWLCFPLFAWGSMGFWVAVVSPILLYYFITKKTGIPPTEAQALKSRGEDYRRYQQEVNAFFPSPPKKAS